jgi:hypothetical protein
MLATLIASVLIAAPAGFTDNATLNVRAAYISDKPVQVFCATDQAAWQAFVQSENATTTDAEGLTPTPGADSTYVAPEVCSVIRLRLKADQ